VAQARGRQPSRPGGTGREDRIHRGTPLGSPRKMKGLRVIRSPFSYSLIRCQQEGGSIFFINRYCPAPNLRLKKASVGKLTFPIPPRPKLILMLCTLIPLLFSSCGGGNAALRKAYIDGLNSEIGYATLDDLISNMGPPQQSIETPEGMWYTWRNVNSGAVSGGVSIGFIGMGMTTPTETGEELNCLFDRKTGRLRNYNYRQW